MLPRNRSRHREWVGLPATIVLTLLSRAFPSHEVGSLGYRRCAAGAFIRRSCRDCQVAPAAKPGADLAEKAGITGQTPVDPSRSGLIGPNSGRKPEKKEIVGAYRYIACKDAEYINGKVNLATTELFDFSEKFYKEYLPYTIELGRSFIQPQYQPSEQFRKGLFSLDNLWDGLGAIVVDNPFMKYYYGKVTMYTDFNVEARDLILAFLKYYFPDEKKLVTPIHGVECKTDVSVFLNEIKNLPYKEGHSILNKRVRALGENIPPLMNAYMNLSSTMRVFGTAINPTFGGVEETGILVRIADIYESKKERHINSYLIEKGLLKA